MWWELSGDRQGDGSIVNGVSIPRPLRFLLPAKPCPFFHMWEISLSCHAHASPEVYPSSVHFHATHSNAPSAPKSLTSHPGRRRTRRALDRQTRTPRQLARLPRLAVRQPAQRISKQLSITYRPYLPAVRAHTPPPRLCTMDETTRTMTAGSGSRTQVQKWIRVGCGIVAGYGGV